VADIIDNSIAATAEAINVILEIDARGNIQVAVADDGCGMDRAGLINALTYGSKRRTDPSSLGKFGLGLKTASTAFCRKLTLVSRNAAEGPVLAATWDLDKVPDHNWSVMIGEPSVEEAELLDVYASGRSGTVVIWDNVDRLLGEYKKAGGAPIRKAKERYLEQLRHHVSMIYQRFLDREDERARNVSVSINGVPVPPWDPFCIGEVKEPI
uniref:ATP-binding protein n=1 Tax=Noviherbaspirillum sp. ST9 TaxID=3401606 RepID=UPI003B58A604